MNFKYPNTCSIIDREMAKGEDSITYNLEAMLKECCPLLIGETRDEFVEQWKDQIFAEMKQFFETVRESNSDIRNTAEEQMIDLKDEIEEKERETEEQEIRCENLRDEISDLEYEIKDLGKQLDALE